MLETSSIASTRTIHNLSKTQHCYYGLVSCIQTSRLEKNPGRSFFECPKYGIGEPHCKFFEWVDASFCESCCDRILALAAQNELLCHEIRNKDVTIKWLQFSVIALVVLLLGILWAPTIPPGWSSGYSYKRMLPF